MRKIVVFNKMTDPLTHELEVFSRVEGVEVVKSPAVTEEELIRDAKDAEVILFTSAKRTRKVLENLDSCKLIVRYGIGYDTVDTDLCRTLGIALYNVPAYCSDSVAQITLAMALTLASHLTEYRG